MNTKYCFLLILYFHAIFVYSQGNPFDLKTLFAIKDERNTPVIQENEIRDVSVPQEHVARSLLNPISLSTGSTYTNSLALGGSEHFAIDVTETIKLVSLTISVPTSGFLLSYGRKSPSNLNGGYDNSRYYPLGTYTFTLNYDCQASTYYIGLLLYGGGSYSITPTLQSTDIQFNAKPVVKKESLAWTPYHTLLVTTQCSNFTVILNSVGNKTISYLKLRDSCAQQSTDSSGVNFCTTNPNSLVSKREYEVYDNDIAYFSIEVTCASAGTWYLTPGIKELPSTYSIQIISKSNVISCPQGCLNGICIQGTCVCRPWASGSNCGTLSSTNLISSRSFSVLPRTTIYTSLPPLSTGGPIQLSFGKIRQDFSGLKVTVMHHSPIREVFSTVLNSKADNVFEICYALTSTFIIAVENPDIYTTKQFDMGVASMERFIFCF
jgi:hypothetical protein